MDMNLAIAGAFLLPRHGKPEGPWDWEARFVWPDDTVFAALRRAIVRAARWIGATAVAVAHPAPQALRA